MQGIDTFTEHDANEIRKLIQEKIIAPENMQKSIRQKIRDIGFYYTDFQQNRIAGGYTVDFFNELIESRRIRILN